MEVNQVKKIIIIILLVGFIGGIFLFFSDHEGFNITVDNQTNTEISGLYLTYDNIKSNIEIPSILSGKEYEFNVNPTEEFGEGSMKLHYKDKKGKLHTEYVFGYIEKGYSGKAIITLKTIDKNGNIQIEIEKNTFLY